MSMSEFLKKIEPRRDYILYWIKVDDKYYVGSTLKLTKRIGYHISRCFNEEDAGYNRVLYKYIRENNIDFTKANFTVEVLLLNHTKEQSLWAERKLLEEFKNEGKSMLNELMPILSEEERKEYRAKIKKENRAKNRAKINEQQRKRRANETPAQKEERLRKRRERRAKKKLEAQNNS